MNVPAPTMRMSAVDYYLLDPAGLYLEEFVLDAGLSAVRLRSAGWTAADGWWSSAEFARAVRADPSVRNRLTTVDRRGAGSAFAGPLPDEEELRSRFRDDVMFEPSAPLRLRPGPDVHRVLFAGEPSPLSGLRTVLRLDPATGAGALRVNDTDCRYALRRVGGVAWAVDVTAEPFDADAVRWLLRQLTGVARSHGLIPATIERLS